MNKEHSYRGFKFNIKVELDHTVEKSPDGLYRTFQHKIILNDMGATNYYNTELCETYALLNRIKIMMGEAEKWVDERLDGHKTYEQLLLESNGFK
jgi:hypothetical protein